MVRRYPVLTHQGNQVPFSFFFFTFCIFALFYFIYFFFFLFSFFLKWSLSLSPSWTAV
ncbi:hypothetical protein H8958_003457, partial [Nasalis larvatus]